jgi:hypothetical protein
VEFTHGKTTIFAQANDVGLHNGTDLSGRLYAGLTF